MSCKKLPIGIQTFRKIREEDCCYVDKTGFALQLIEDGTHYFLSRPRRFGKSLFLDTLAELFSGRRELFTGLEAEQGWDWSVRYPVIRLDFAAGVLQDRDALDRRLQALLRLNAERLGVSCDWQKTDLPGCFGDLIRQAHSHCGQRVVVLVDEYDKPILDNIERPEIAAEMREGLKNLYSVLKPEDAHLQFVFMTGVTKFSQVSLFSGLNQLRDITLSADYATLCGYTQQDLETTFAGHLTGVDRDELRTWYNGHSFLGEPVYNPFDILLFISEGHSYRNYWFETGSPSFLIKLFQRKRYFLPELEALEVSEEILDAFDVERINPVTLLFQSGYLTIAETVRRRGRLLFRLRIPNQEVRFALTDQLITGYTGIENDRTRWQDGLYDTLAAGDLPGLVATLKRLFAGIPWRNFTHNDLPEAEGYYASVLYAFFASLNAQVIPEDISSQGQTDLTIKLEGYIYVMEIKLQRGPAGPDSEQDSEQGAKAGETTANPALAQIQARGYSAKYRDAPGKGLFEVGLVFSASERNLVRADWQRVA
ncbi:ATP-binding protein [Thiohalocapsa marina]|uniref:ATP-binding protein n=1 Tax=Thiohalocapsa marina TaxID=424902 RepID=A0A5M8FRF4_9GAMM|nr:ATP-binding protein [Thiohalocapsa marina]KAA6186746.1 ATP-binding protein [Thiohalocapsa marina]